MMNELAVKRRSLDRSLVHALYAWSLAGQQNCLRLLILWHIIIRHCLRVTLIQVKQLIDFLLLQAKLA
jgi:hypothetical protein